MNNLQIFNYKGNEVRTVEKDGITWWVLKDVCNILDIKNVTQMAQRLDEDERSMFNIGRQGETNIVNESGLYNVILRSDKEEAKPFRKWVTSEVLPSIRKHGAYMTPEKLKEVILNPDTMIELCRALKTEREQRIKLEQEVNLLIPDANMARDIIKYNGLYTLKEVADLIEKGRTELCTLFRKSKILLSIQELAI